MYELYLTNNKNVVLTPPVEDLILAAKFTKSVKQNTYLESDLRKMTADKAQLFAKSFGIPSYDPTLNERIIRILRYKGALKPEYYSPKKLAAEKNIKQQVEAMINQLPNIAGLKNNIDQNLLRPSFRIYSEYNVSDISYFIILKAIIDSIKYDNDIFDLIDKYPAVKSYLINNNVILPENLVGLTSGDDEADEETAKKILTAIKSFINLYLITY